MRIEGLAGASPKDVFEHIFTEELWTRLVTETNKFAEQHKLVLPEAHTNSTETPPAKKSKMIPWKPVSIPEMKTFIGLCLAMGIVRLSVRRDYWRLKKPLFTTAFPHHMSRDRFADIWR